MTVDLLLKWRDRALQSNGFTEDMLEEFVEDMDTVMEQLAKERPKRLLVGKHPRKPGEDAVALHD